MVEYSSLVLTEQGKELLTKALEGSQSVNFTKVSVSNTAYSETDIPALTSLDPVDQTSLISKKTRTGDTIKIEVAFENRELTTGYYMRTLGLYANSDDSSEILFAACIAQSDNCYLPAYNNKTILTVTNTLYLTIGTTANVILEVDPAAYVTSGQLQEALQGIKSGEETVLWENASPTSGMMDVTLTIGDYSNYKFLHVYMDGEKNTFDIDVAKKQGGSIYAEARRGRADSSYAIYSRELYATLPNELWIGASYYVVLYGDGRNSISKAQGAGYQPARNLIPCKITASN